MSDEADARALERDRPMHYAFVESNTTGTGRLAVEQLLRAGHRVTFLTRCPSKYPFLSEPSPGLSVVDVETNDPETVARAIGLLRTNEQLDAALSFSTYYVATAAAAARRWGLRALDPRAAQTCHDKPAMRRLLRDAGLPIPRFWVVDSPEAAIHAANEVAYPCVVKPTSESGSNGVRLVQNAGELRAHCRFLATLTRNEREQAQPGWSLVEELLFGPEFSVETLTSSADATVVIGITAKHLSPLPYFAEMGHDFPADIGVPLQQALEAATLAGLKAVGYDFGPAHTELRLTRAGPVIVEVNPRLAGGMIPELVRLASGIDLISAVLALFVGKPPPLTRARADSASIRFLTAHATGRLRRQPLLDHARGIPLVRQVAVEKQPGTMVRPARCASDRLGYVIASGPESKQVAAAAVEAVSSVRLDVERSVDGVVA